MHGQLEPVGVFEGGPEGYDYTLSYGYRRTAGAQLVGMKTILAVVGRNQGGLGLAILNLVENKDREDVHAVDLATRVHEIASGKLSVKDGEDPVPLPRDEVAKLLGMNRSQVNKLLHVHEAISEDVRAEARKVGAPMRLLIRMSSLESDEQKDCLDQWAKDQKELADAGRKRAKRTSRASSESKGDDEEGDGEPKAALSPKKRIPYAGSAVSVEQLLAAAQHKYDLGSKAEQARFGPMIDVLRFLTGQIKRIEGITKADLERGVEAES